MVRKGFVIGYERGLVSEAETKAYGLGAMVYRHHVKLELVRMNASL